MCVARLGDRADIGLECSAFASGAGSFHLVAASLKLKSCSIRGGSLVIGMPQTGSITDALQTDREMAVYQGSVQCAAFTLSVSACSLLDQSSQQEIQFFPISSAEKVLKLKDEFVLRGTPGMPV